MNKFEKQVFNSLSEEEQEKIAGGGNISPGDDLTKEQCGKLKNAAIISNISKHPEFIHNALIAYGGPMPVILPHCPTKPTKPLQPLNPVTPEETQQSTTAPNTTEKS